PERPDSRADCVSEDQRPSEASGDGSGTRKAFEGCLGEIERIDDGHGPAPGLRHGSGATFRPVSELERSRSLPEPSGLGAQILREPVTPRSGCRMSCASHQETTTAPELEPCSSAAGTATVAATRAPS